MFSKGSIKFLLEFKGSFTTKMLTPSLDPFLTGTGEFEAFGVPGRVGEPAHGVAIRNQRPHRPH